jgi:hypothetical protein
MAQAFTWMVTSWGDGSGKVVSWKLIWRGDSTMGMVTFLGMGSSWGEK